MSAEVAGAAALAVNGGASGALPSGTRLSVLSIELPHAITPTIAGLTVGAFVGVVGFVAVLLLVGRGSRRGTARRVQMPADQVVFIPPYGTLQRDTPLPPAAFHVPPQATQIYTQAQVRPHVHLNAHAQAHHAHGAPLPFRPSTDLSARAFAKMGYDVGDDERDSPNSDPEMFVECDMFEDDDVVPTRAFAPPSAPVSVSAIIVVEESGGVRSADKSAPHPLGIIPTGSSAMVAAPPSSTPPAAQPPVQAAPRPVSFADLEMDDGATEIGEPYFDEPPQPRRRTDPPKIRAVAPAAPRFPASAHLPHPTPPPQRAVPSARG